MDAQPYRHVEMPKDFFGIEEVDHGTERSNREVTDNRAASERMKENNAHQDEDHVFYGGAVTAGGIEDVVCTSPEERSVAYGGTISWVSMENTHRTRMRTSITVVALLLWIGWTVIGLAIFALTKNPVLLISSPVTATGVALYKILSRIVAYYFSQ